MEMISATRMRRAQDRALSARPYTEKTRDLIRQLAGVGTSEAMHPLLSVRPVRSLALVIMASDRGLCGAYNSNVIHLGLDYARRCEVPVVYIAVGCRAREAIVAAQGDLIAEFEGMPADITISHAAPIARLLEDAFLAGDVDAASIAYTRFVGLTVQVPSIREVLPIVPEAVGASQRQGPSTNGGGVKYIYEPSASEILGYLLPQSLEVEVMGCLLESAASEHSARMVAMRNATENATDIAEDLVRLYNRARQESITNEILDIIGATEAIRAR